MQPGRIRGVLWSQGRARTVAPSEGEGAVSEVYGVGKGVAARMRRVPGKVGLEPRLQVDLCSEAPGRSCCIWTEESESRAVVDRKRKGLRPAGRCTGFCLIAWALI